MRGGGRGSQSTENVYSLAGNSILTDRSGHEKYTIVKPRYKIGPILLADQSEEVVRQDAGGLEL
jgi:hypothetical protein